MDAASGSQPARDNASTPDAHGVTVGPLMAAHPDRIVLANRTFFLPDGLKCDFPPGTPLQVIYTERDGRREAQRITPTAREG